MYPLLAALSTAVTCLALVSCGTSDSGSDDASRPRSPSATSTSTTHEAPSGNETRDTQEPDSPYSRTSVRVTYGDGWVYRFDPKFAIVTSRSGKTTETSPPGKAKVQYELEVPESFTWSFVGDTPGRTPADIDAGVGIFLPLAESQPVGLQGLNGGCSAKSYGNVPSFFGRETLFCELDSEPGALFDYPGGEDYDEAQVESTIAALTAARPFVGVAFHQGYGFEATTCLAFYLPNGTVELVESGPNPAGGPPVCKLELIA